MITYTYDEIKNILSALKSEFISILSFEYYLALASLIFVTYFAFNIFPILYLIYPIIYILYRISLKVKYKPIKFLLNTFFILLVFIKYLTIRIETNKTIEIKSNIIYGTEHLLSSPNVTAFDFFLPDFRSLIEHKINNRRVYFKDTLPNLNYLYLDNESFIKLQPESPWTMRDKNYTIKATLQANELIFGGYSVAKLKNIEIVNEPARVSKM